MSFLYQHFLYHINPVVFSIGSFAVRWYALMYIAGFVVVFGLLTYRIKKKESGFSDETLIQLLVYIFVGIIIGGRLGYVLFYEPAHYLHNPLAIISPFDKEGSYTGIYGMSYFGGLIGAIIISYFYLKSQKQSFLAWADFIIPAVPLGYFFGRLGNFINGELYGRVTQMPWGMYFPADTSNILRHPSQLYEAFFEGVVLFVVLWSLRNKNKFPGQLLLIYIFGYAIIRFMMEFFREEKAYAFFAGMKLTEGQLFSLVAIIVVVFFFHLCRKRYAII